ncbi:hypothetical protein HD806DRAFT_502678 [Xylariaceae sp. AK1471]|nr:hypothetical protein HD806DRAFT_502678 [Xylariaceae sp. AK1471]
MTSNWFSGQDQAYSWTSLGRDDYELQHGLSRRNDDQQQQYLGVENTSYERPYTDRSNTNAASVSPLSSMPSQRAPTPTDSLLIIEDHPAADTTTRSRRKRLFGAVTSEGGGISRRENKTYSEVRGTEVDIGSRKSYLTWKDKLGILAIVTLLLAPLLTLGAVAVLSFLWFGNVNAPWWQYIVSGHSLSRTVAIVIEVFRQASSFQLGVAVAMLAALALESFEVTLPSMASVTMMRATASSPTVFVMLWHYIRGFWTAGFRFSRLFILGFIVGLLWLLDQVMLIILLTDVSLRPTQGYTQTEQVAYNFHYNVSNVTNVLQSGVIQREGTWTHKAPYYPTFAEYSEPPYVGDGVSDTGVTLRAFLPFDTSQTRENLHSYAGNATVLDARVTCQIPHFDTATIQVPYNLSNLASFQGSVSASRHTPRLGNATVQLGHKNPYNSSVAFSCLTSLTDDQTVSGEWRLSLCQLFEGGNYGGTFTTYSGGLVSEFKDLNAWYANPRDSNTYGTAYLILNTTLGSGELWERALVSGQPGEKETAGYYPVAYQERGEWMDFVYSKGDVVLSATLCYAAFDTADIPVHITSRSNRTESDNNPIFNVESAAYTFDGLRHQMGQDKSLSLDHRGILELKRQPWVTTPGENVAGINATWDRDGSETSLVSTEPFIRAFADLGVGPNIEGGNAGNISGILRSLPASASCDLMPFGETYCVNVDPMHIWLVQEILRTGGSMAFALQTMITLLSGMAYYDQIGQFDKVAEIRESLYEVADVPVGHLGLSIVIVTMLLHIIVSTIILFLFLRHTSLSRLGATWSTLAQGSSGDASVYLDHAELLSDKEIEKKMESDGVKDSRVRLEEQDGRVHLFRKIKGNPEIRTKTWHHP